jgi:oligogalacturonide transport system substrate-binding protein
MEGNNMKKRVLSILLAVTMAAGVLAGCGSTQSKSKKTEKTETTKKDTGKGYEDCTLKMDWWGGDSRHEATQNAVNAFMQKYPGINVEVNFGAWSDWETAKAAEYTSGTNPDVQQTNFDWIGKYDASGDTYLDLNKVKDTLDLTQWSKSDLEMTKDVKGGIAGIPVAMTGRLFYWNKATWEKAGLELPKSLKDLEAAGPVFKEKLGDNYYPLVVGEYDRAILMTYYLQNETGKPIISNKNKLNYTEKDFQKGIQFIQDLEDKHVIPSEKYIQGEGADSMDKSARFINGEYAGILEWDTAAGKYVAALGDAASNFVVGGELSGLKPYSKVSLMFSISAKTKHPHEAALLLNYLLNDEEGVKAMGTQRGIPESKAAYKTLEAAGSLDQMSVDAHKAVTDSKPLYWNPLFDDASLKGDAGTAYTDVFDQLSYKQIDVDTAAKNLFNAYKAICK